MATQNELFLKEYIPFVQAQLALYLQNTGDKDFERLEDTPYQANERVFDALKARLPFKFDAATPEEKDAYFFWKYIDFVCYFWNGNSSAWKFDNKPADCASYEYDLLDFIAAKPRVSADPEQTKIIEDLSKRAKVLIEAINTPGMVRPNGTLDVEKATGISPEKYWLFPGIEKYAGPFLPAKRSLLWWALPVGALAYLWYRSKKTQRKAR